VDKDKALRMAQKAGLHLATETNWLPIIHADYAERLIQIAQAEEREACVELCVLTEQMCKAVGLPTSAVEACAEAIRARGNE